LFGQGNFINHKFAALAWMDPAYHKPNLISKWEQHNSHLPKALKLNWSTWKKKDRLLQLSQDFNDLSLPHYILSRARHSRSKTDSVIFIKSKPIRDAAIKWRTGSALQGSTCVCNHKFNRKHVHTCFNINLDSLSLSNQTKFENDCKYIGETHPNTIYHYTHLDFHLNNKNWTLFYGLYTKIKDQIDNKPTTITIQSQTSESLQLVNNNMPTTKSQPTLHTNGQTKITKFFQPHREHPP
jgi:hypothetical protein